MAEPITTRSVTYDKNGSMTAKERVWPARSFAPVRLLV